MNLHTIADVADVVSAMVGLLTLAFVLFVHWNARREAGTRPPRNAERQTKRPGENSGPFFVFSRRRGEHV